MSDVKDIYIIMRKSGRIMAQTGMGLGPHWTGPLWAIYAAVDGDPGQEQRDYDPPERLFLNGTEVISSGLYNMARRYVADRQQARLYAEREVHRMHQHLWQPSHEKTGSNPPGVDVWEIKKVRDRA